MANQWPIKGHQWLSAPSLGSFGQRTHLPAIEGDRAALRQEVCAMLEPIVAGHPFYALTLGFLECPAVQLVMRGTDLRVVEHVRQPARLRLPKLS